MISENYKYSITIWQQHTDDGIPPEPAIIVESFSDLINIKQEDHEVSINFDSIDDLIKVLRKIQKDKK